MKTDKTGLLSGAMFASFGVAALVLGRNLTLGSAANMGPGYFPRVLGILLVVIGIIIALRALRAKRAELPRIACRPVIALTVALVLFSQLLPVLGMVASLLLLVATSRISRAEYGWRETVALSLVLTFLCVAIFHFGLGLQLPLWPALD